MDDGADTPETALKMLEILRKQGVTKIVATPHFYPGKETPEEFIKRRTLAAEPLQEYELTYGSEVHIFRELPDLDLPQLCIGDTKHILLELPYADYESWMSEAMWNAVSTHKLTPVLAHLDRYILRYSASDLEEVLSLPGLVVQINADAFYNKKIIKVINDLAKRDFPIVLGSDAHNVDDRAPDFAPALKYLTSKKGGALLEHIRNSDFL
jgi:protein-tyrosine phosphatase